MSVNTVASLLYVRGLVDESESFDHMLNLAQKVIDCCERLIQDLNTLSDEATEAEIQSCFYEAGKIHFAHDLRYWFKIMYQMLLKQSDGPRLGQFTQIMTQDWVQNKIREQITDPWHPQAMCEDHASQVM